MILNETTNLDVENDADLIIYYGLFSSEPGMTLENLRGLDIPAGEKISLARKIMDYNHPTNEKIKDLYSQAVGEIGISPSDFWTMTEEEVLIAYEGYMRRMEATANLTLLAVHKALKDDTNCIELLEDKGYTVGSIEERDRVFSNLNIQE